MSFQLEWLPPIIGAAGLLAAFVLFAYIVKFPAGEGRMTTIASQILKGANVFLKAEYSKLGIFTVVLAVILYFSFGDEGPQTAHDIASQTNRASPSSVVADFIKRRAEALDTRRHGFQAWQSSVAKHARERNLVRERSAGLGRDSGQSLDI